MQEAALQIGERLLHYGDAVAHREQALDFFSAQNRTGHSMEGGSFQTRHIC